MMSNAQPTGWLLPQMPMPFNSSQPTETIRPLRSRKPKKKATYQGSGCRPRSTTLLIFSVTDDSVCPGSMTGCSWYSTTAPPCERSDCEFISVPSVGPRLTPG
jgi:hypothetical protein